jgi:hypothetical protein
VSIERFAAVVFWKRRKFAIARLGALICDGNRVVLVDGSDQQLFRCPPAEITFTPLGGVGFLLSHDDDHFRVNGPIDSLAKNHRATACAEKYRALIVLPFRTEETMHTWERRAIKTHGRQLGAGASADMRWQRRQWREIWRNELLLAGAVVEEDPS